MNKPNRHLDLTKTNYWINLKKKAKNAKTGSEQAEVNQELMNCIAILESRLNNLQALNSGMVDTLGTTSSAVTDVILPHLRAVESVIGREKVREKFDILVKESKNEVENQGENFTKSDK